MHANNTQTCADYIELHAEHTKSLRNILTTFKTCALRHMLTALMCTRTHTY
uniref:Uncharacterized protein n=1 Tax=Arion vulgaris TaxID=1028688 RepID=A0A0B7B3G6_9EUPU